MTSLETARGYTVGAMQAVPRRCVCFYDVIFWPALCPFGFRSFSGVGTEETDHLVCLQS